MSEVQVDHSVRHTLSALSRLRLAITSLSHQSPTPTNTSPQSSTPQSDAWIHDHKHLVQGHLQQEGGGRVNALHLSDEA